ncbi:FHA domain-containing serine/threonine-protein kinase [Schlesneria paludicola]|uniref:FHA domain-containing serine/threonine-protein kinase n=1 Tax=Schlesneria paludicola TaxID=360056 RepID=UPI00138ABF2E|nr:FHA domain-containing serine/threonine-protein kinase [Schlesneria paludicola]
MQLTQSGLIPPREVRALARSLSSEGMVTDAAAARKLVEQGHLTRFQADRLLEGRARGFFFDQYKLLDLVGVGGMGWVYRASNTETGEIYALKILLEQFKNDRGMIVRFEQEARAGLKLQHENILRTDGFGSAGGLPYVVMEFVQGPSLLELLRMRERSRLPWEQACDVIRQAAKAVHHVHQVGFVHRDIKPQNLLIDHSGHVKLLDFGLAMFRDGEKGDEFSMAMIFGHECVGTAAFMAPEQVADSLNADARSDVYSLGCTMFAILTGDTPFPYADTKEVVRAHQSQIPRNVCDIVPSIPQGVGEIVAKMLAKNPDDRFATADDVVNALSIWAKTSPVEFDFDKVLAERNKCARDKLAEFQRRQRSSSSAANSTAKPATVSSVATSASGTVSATGLEKRSPMLNSSIVRRDPFGFEHPPAIVLRPGGTDIKTDTFSTKALKSGKALLPLSGGGLVPLVKDRFVIGRAPGCDMQVQDASVSSRHCELQFDGSQWSLVDLKSRNGVRVNGDVVKSHLLQPGDMILLGASLRLRFTDLHGDARNAASRRYRSYLLAMSVALAVATLAATAWMVWGSGGV